MTTPPQLVDSGPAYTQSGLAHRVERPTGNGRRLDGPHPTVIMLHGYLGNEDVMWIFARSLPKHWLKVAPRGLERMGEASYSWGRLPDAGWPDLAAFQPATTAVTHFIDSLPDLYQADPGQIYLMGFSQGAAVAYALALANPQLAQGIAGLVGFMPEMPPDPLPRDHWRGLPIFMATSLNDEMIPLKIARRSADAARRLGATLAHYEYETGHRLNADGMRDLREWWGGRP